MYQYATLNNISAAGLSRFTPEYALTDDLSQAQAILVRSAKMHEMEFSDSLLAIARAGAGVNNIPLERCAQQGIVVFNTPGANANAVKELVFAGMLLGSRDIVEGVDWVRGSWNDPDIAKDAEREKKKFAGQELAGRRLGIIGLGAIGVRVANAAVDFGMEVLGYDPYVSVDSAWQLSTQIVHVTDVREIYETCDYITIHVPAMPSTKGMIDREAIGQMKPGVVLLNMARDVLVDEEAVVEAVSEGRIRRYVSDFPNPTVAGRRGCITTPHLGASTQESEEKCARMAVDELMDYLENGNILHSVNYPAVSLGVCESASRIAIFHANRNSMISAFTAIIGGDQANIAGMASKAKGDLEYTLLDLDAPLSAESIERLRQTAGVLRVRVVR